MTWLSSYIGSWLLLQGAIDPSFVANVLNLGQPDNPSKATVADSSEPTLLPSTSDVLPVEAILSLSEHDKPAMAAVRTPWRLPDTSVAVASVRIAESGQAPKRDALTYDLGDGTAGGAVDYRTCLDWTAAASTAAQPFQVLVNEQVIAEFPQREQAYGLGRQLTELLSDTTVDPSDLVIEQDGAVVTGRWQQDRLFAIDASLSQHIGHPAPVVGVTWISALRSALDQPPLSPAEMTTVLEGLSPTKEHFSGVASWYGAYFHGRKTANGETFDQNELTAAHPSLPFNTYLKVTNQINGRSVVVRVNDRGPYVGRRSLDLSRRAARCLNSEI
ncbi:MAG: septal ring lytic transglycosylase RlpA family protein, partial [Elainellaceae cyanobacterium]